MPAPEADPPRDYCAQRTAMMPKRRRTRAQNRADRVASERRKNHAARNVKSPSYFGPTFDGVGPAPPDPDDDPPPF